MSDWIAIQEHYWAERAYDMTLGEIKPGTIHLVLASTRLAIEVAEQFGESANAQELKESYHGLAGQLERMAKVIEKPTQEQAQKWASQIRFLFAMMPAELKGYVSEAATAVLGFCGESWVDAEINRSEGTIEPGKILPFAKERSKENEEKET